MSHYTRSQEAINIAYVREFLEQNDQDVSLSSFTDLIALHTKKDEFSDVDKSVNGSFKHHEAQRTGSALKPRQDLSIGKSRTHKYSNMSISKLRFYDEYVDMKIGKVGLPMYVDFHDMLLQCAYAVGLNDINSAKAVACKVKQQTSACGSAAERLAHYFVKALYARFVGTGWSL
ncbi:hypothetical protein L7F22_047610 [Adiantum nelumboides]|nr:hypothetical protein [Adiantum nelumboides]